MNAKAEKVKSKKTIKKIIVAGGVVLRSNADKEYFGH